MNAALWWTHVVLLTLNALLVGIRIAEGTWSTVTWLNLVAAIWLALNIIRLHGQEQA